MNYKNRQNSTKTLLKFGMIEFEFVSDSSMGMLLRFIWFYLSESRERICIDGMSGSWISLVKK
jgi:hypothetical protein